MKYPLFYFFFHLCSLDSLDRVLVDKQNGPKLGGINVIPGQIQGNAGEKLQLLSTDLEASTPYGDSGNKIRGPN